MEMSLDLSLSYCAYRDTSVALVADINLLTRVNFRALKHDPATHIHAHTRRNVNLLLPSGSAKAIMALKEIVSSPGRQADRQIVS